MGYEGVSEKNQTPACWSILPTEAKAISLKVQLVYLKMAN
jgi:hypothetical protein